MHYLIRLLFTITIVLTCFRVVHADEGVLVVHVSNPLKQPISGVVLSALGDSSTGPPTDVAGKTRIRLAPQTRPGSEVPLQVVRAPQDLVFISPWNQRVTVRSFDNEAENVAEVVLAERGSRMLLEYPQVALALVSNVNATNATKLSTEPLTEQQRRANLAEVAKAFGFTPEEVDRAIRALGGKATEPYQLGLVALYEKNYPEAERYLLISKAERRDSLADVSVSLGHVYLEQGKYGNAVKEYQEAAVLRPDDINPLNRLGLALLGAGQYAEAEPLYKRTLMIAERQLGPEHIEVASSLHGLATVYESQGKYAEAELLFKRVLAISEKQLRPGYPFVAAGLNSLATLYLKQGKYSEAEPLLKRALAMSEKQLQPGHRELAASLHNLAGLYASQSRYAEAEPLYKRALAIFEKQLGPEHPDVATGLNSLATLYSKQGKYSEAEPLYKRALAMREKLLGPEHLDVADSLYSLGRLYREQRRYAEAEQLFNRALALREKSLGSEHPKVALSLHSLALLYGEQGRYVEAGPLYQRALAIYEKQLAPQGMDMALLMEDYVVLLRKMNRITEAERMEARAKVIRAKQK